MKQIVVIGAGGFGRECAEIIICMMPSLSYQLHLLGFLDDSILLLGKKFNGIEVLGGLDYYVGCSDIHFVVGVGDPRLRKILVKIALEMGYKPATIIHPSVKIYTGAQIGKGVVIQAGSQIGINTKIGDHVHINFNCSIGHDVVLEDYVTISPLVAISGGCVIEKGGYMGSSSSIIPLKRVGKWSKIGAGACVIKNIPSRQTAIGVPAINKNRR